MSEDQPTYTVSAEAAARQALDHLAGLRAEQAQLNQDYNGQRAAIMARVQADLDALDLEFGPRYVLLNGALAAAEQAVAEHVLIHGATVKGAQLQAVYVRGAAKWDNAKLEGYAAEHPVILGFRSFGEPRVQVRGLSR